MVALSSITAALGAVGLSLLSSTPGASATPGLTRRPASPSYRSSEVCPERCSISGANMANWSVYPSFDMIQKCQKTMFYSFSLHDPVDESGANHKIYACSSYGPDFGVLPPIENTTVGIVSAQSINVEFEMGWFREGFGLAKAGIRSIVRQMRSYTENGHGNTEDRPFMMYGKSGLATVGLYIGQGLLNQGLAETALRIFHDNMLTLNVSSTPSIAMQLCGPEYGASQIFGIMATSEGTFMPIQNAIKSWANASCLEFTGSTTFAGAVRLTMPLKQNRTAPVGPAHLHGNSTNTRRGPVHAYPRAHFHQSSLTTVRRTLLARAECSTVQVEPGDSCATLATKCGISPAEFTKYNNEKDFCSKLMPKQHVCCTEGQIPDFSPKPNEDGSCFSYQVKENDNCDNLAAEFSVTREDLEDFNKNTWGWNGCELLFIDTVMCLSEGDAPFPAPIANAICGPQKPGSEPPTDDSDISEMNPCPLNACCNIWGQCGITKDFCVDTNTGAPGTAEPGTYGCISNCGMDIKKGSGNGEIKIGYYQGYCLSRDCLYQDPMQIDTSAYTHLHFGFGTLTAHFDVEVGDQLSTYMFNRFKTVKGAKRILSLGGWAFSTESETYRILRDGVKPANRLTMATKIANFITEHDLDGVDIDWEYPGAPDLPTFDPGTEEDGPNYLAFLVVLKNLLPGKSVAIAAPASYWYLKQFPIAQISKVVDYIVYMTYDLHGQWDAHNSNSQEGCDTGNCLRSQVNLTETRQSLAMITKAGVPGEKVVVGVTSYGRSFKMAEAGCYGPTCTFTGDRLNSYAKKGRCTGTAGYIADAEIAEILADDRRVVTHFVDPSSNSDILVYDETEWVGYMSSSTKKTRATLYTNWGMGGTSDWASDLQSFHSAPWPAEDWVDYKGKILVNEDPLVDDTRNGNWTDFDCTHPMVKESQKNYPEVRWQTLGADAAWRDVVRIFKETDKPVHDLSFWSSLISTLQLGEQSNCGSLNQDSCVSKDCHMGANGDTSGPAGYLIYNSLVKIHLLHKDYYDGLMDAAGLVSYELDHMETTFAPIPPEDNEWKLLLIDLLTLGALGTAGPMFNSVLRRGSFFLKDNRLDNSKDTAMTLIGQSTTIAKDVLPTDKTPWTLEDQDKFSAYMGQVISGWTNMTSLALKKLFDGSDDSLEALYAAMSNGKLIDGKSDQDPEGNDTTTKNDLQANIKKAIFGYSIPELWRESESYAFVIDAGHACGKKELTEYLHDETMNATGACVDGSQYYLVYPEGDGGSHCSTACDSEGYCETTCVDSKFSAPPGLNALNSSDFGGISVADLIEGSVRTWEKNDKKNGVGPGFASPDNALTVDNLLDADFTTPGFIRLPVCDADRAYQSWDTSKAGSSANYPCDIPPSKDECGESTFENETSEASPLIKDCLQIIRNIEGDASTDFTHEVVGKRHRQLGQHATCAFGVEATKVDGNVNFKVGGQDIIDIINDAVKLFGSGERIGAKGEMKCNGNDHQQPVLWGIYHD